MKFTPLALQGAYVVEIDRHEDERGFFARTWDRDEFAALGLPGEVVQCSVSRNTLAGTLRGLHFQAAPHAETKLVRCTRGTIYDVIVDLRVDSPTHTHWVAVELDAGRANALFVPRGFAHGFQTLRDDSEVFYMMSTPYVAEASTGVRWDDPAFGIDWPPAVSRVMSPRDAAWPDYDPGNRLTRGT
jgi:dTDP-4-dehydrorhamnose 3,5-epimerase